MSRFGTPRYVGAPMEWQFDQEAPQDPSSPFANHNSQNKFSFGSQPGSFAARPSTPAAAPFRNPSFPSTTDPAPAHRSSSFTTPQKPFDQGLLSETSGAESSPADNADAEDTPERQAHLSTMTHKHSQPIFGSYGASLTGAGGHGRISKRGNKYGMSIRNKLARKRKRQHTGTELVRSRSDYEYESDISSDTQPQRQSSLKEDPRRQLAKANWFSNLLSSIESRPNLPNVLSYYAQLSLNFFFVFLIMYAVWAFWTTVISDVDKESEKAAAAVLEEMRKCAEDYVANGCASAGLAPVLQPICHNFEICMNRDARSVGRARVSAHTFAQIINSFIEPISYKAMIFVVIILASSILVNNLAFGMLRQKTSQAPQHFFPQHPQPSQAASSGFDLGGSEFTPRTPTHHHFDNYLAGTPYQTPHTSFQHHALPAPHRSPSKESRRSPSRGGGKIRELM